MCGWLHHTPAPAVPFCINYSYSIVYHSLTRQALLAHQARGSPGTSAPAVPFCGCPIDGSLVRQSVGHCQLNPIGRSAVFGGMRM